jgi:hypothetical protein
MSLQKPKHHKDPPLSEPPVDAEPAFKPTHPFIKGLAGAASVMMVGAAILLAPITIFVFVVTLAVIGTYNWLVRGKVVLK